MWFRGRKFIDILMLAFLYSFFLYWTLILHPLFSGEIVSSSEFHKSIILFLMINFMIFVPICIICYFLLFFKDVAPEIIYAVLAMLPLFLLFFDLTGVTMKKFLTLLGYGIFVSFTATTIFLKIDKKWKTQIGT